MWLRGQFEALNKAKLAVSVDNMKMVLLYLTALPSFTGLC